MLFRTNKGELVELKKYGFPNDKLYYEKVMEMKKPGVFSTKTTPFSKSIEYFTKK
jgi:hypothetical protein